MVQDLNFLLNKNVPLNPSTTDITTTWTPENSTQTSEGTKWDDPSANIARSYTNGARTYYNFRATTAGTTSSSTTSGNASGSVCPKGWKLPSGGYSGEYYKLISTRYRIENSSTGSAKLRSAPLSFNYTGMYDYSSGSVRLADSYGWHWSGTIYSADMAYRPSFDSNSVNPQARNVRGLGLALRCIAR